MRLADKRKVIEVLLCCSSEWSPDTTDGAAHDLGFRYNTTGRDANIAWGKAYADLCRISSERARVMHFEASVEAAYRLIESSATLRREWFRAS